MTISVPDTLTSDFSEKYIMSIRLWSGGLSFSAYNPSEGQSFFFREIEFNRARPYVEWLKDDVFFANECLAWTYKRTYVLCMSPQYTLAPDKVAPDKKKSQLLSFNFSSPEKRCLSNHLKEEETTLIFGVNEEVYEFCSRSLTNPVFTHHITSQLIMLGKQSRNGKNNQMFVVLHRRMMDVICFSAGKLTFVNSFNFEQLNDLLYYILCVWKQTGMNQLNDALFLAGDTSMSARLTHFLQTYIQHIGRMEIPAKAYLLGGEILQAPIDLLLLSVCES
jgi:hypothetical protein